jgi:hypothetical protein
VGERGERQVLGRLEKDKGALAAGRPGLREAAWRRTAFDNPLEPLEPPEPPGTRARDLTRKRLMASDLAHSSRVSASIGLGSGPEYNLGGTGKYWYAPDSGRSIP